MNIETFLNNFNPENSKIISIKEINKKDIEIVVQINGVFEIKSAEIYFDFDFPIGENK